MLWGEVGSVGGDGMLWGEVGSVWGEGCDAQG